VYNIPKHTEDLPMRFAFHRPTVLGAAWLLASYKETVRRTIKTPGGVTGQLSGSHLFAALNYSTILVLPAADLIIWRQVPLGRA